MPDMRARFQDAIRSFARRTDVVPKDQFLELSRLNRSRAWTVARVADADVLSDVWAATSQAIESGENFGAFRESLSTIMESRGWEGLEPWHARLVFDQNVGMAYSAGRFQQSADAGMNYWRYLPSRSANPRPEHEPYYGKVYRLGDGPMPPIDFNCQCDWEPVFDDEVEGPVEQRLSVPPDQEFKWWPSDYGRPVKAPRTLPPAIREELARLERIEPDLRLDWESGR